MVKESLVEYAGDSTFVYVQTQPQVFEKTEISVGLSDGIIVVIKDGITADSELRGRQNLETTEGADY